MGGGGRHHLEVAQSTPDAAYRNRLLVSPTHQFENDSHVVVKAAGKEFRMTVLKHPSIQEDQAGLNAKQREWIGVSAAAAGRSGDIIEVGLDDYPVPTLDAINIKIIDVSPRDRAGSTVRAADMEVDFRGSAERGEQGMYCNQVFQIGQPFFWNYNGLALQCKVTDLPGDIDKPKKFGVVTQQTLVFVTAESGKAKVIADPKRRPPNAVVSPDFKFEDMGIGGLDTEFGNIFRRAFASRVFPLELVEKLGIQHVRGLLLYGPPGTGKTLMARQIGKMLNAREPKVVNGPEILNKFVGASEENVRKLFEEAEKEYKARGDESDLHIIIIDEIDAICKQRGSTSGGTGVGDSIVNQLLSKMDGVDQLNNILLIGMTNRLDMIDDALLRPGRLEVHMEVSLPDENGRLQILKIHTAKMRNNDVMEQDVDLEELAKETKNFSGAEISGLVKSATSWAFNRHIKVGTMAGISDDISNLKVNRQDFMRALEEVKPAFGVSEEELKQVIQNGIIDYSSDVTDVLSNGQLLVKQVRESDRTPLVTTLLYGPPGSGKTALAATIAQESEYPFIKIVSPEHMVGFSEAHKIATITKVFSDSYKSPLSVIVVDNLERLIDWVQIGPRFSNGVLQALMVLLSRRPPKGRRLLIIATTSNRPMITEMELSEVFDSVVHVRPISHIDSLKHVIQSVGLFPEATAHRDIEAVVNRLPRKYFEEGTLSVGIKKLMSMIEMARQEPERAVDRLVQALIDHHTGI
jgi:vesicle-fusing ATPase